MKLYFVRHGIAMEREEWVGNDLERPLTEQGTRKTRKAMSALSKLGFVPDIILSSFASRAHRTGQIYFEELKQKDIVFWQSESLNPGSEPETMLKAVKEAREKRIAQRWISHITVALVGHEPDISDLIAFLFENPSTGKYLDGLEDSIHQVQDYEKCNIKVQVKKASFIEIEIDPQTGPTLIHCIQPATLRQLS